MEPRPKRGSLFQTSRGLAAQKVVNAMLSVSNQEEIALVRDALKAGAYIGREVAVEIDGILEVGKIAGISRAISGQIIAQVELGDGRIAHMISRAKGSVAS